MPVKTEYSRIYRQLSPNSPCPHVPAGKSSAKLATTQEPAVGMKKKVNHTPSSVGLITGLGDENRQPEEEHAGFRFKAGFRRPPKIPLTAYQRDFPWPETTPTDTPLMNAQNMLHKSSQNITTKPKPQTVKQASGSPVLKCDQCANSTHKQSQSKAPVPTSEPTDNGAKATKSDKARTSSKQRQIIQELMAQQPGRSSGGKSPKKKTHKKKFRQFMTVYQREFGSVKKSNKKSKLQSDSFVAGMPRVLSDVTDPRLLKHSPLPLDAPTTANSWVTDNMANFVSPVESDYLHANNRSSPSRHNNNEPNASPITADIELQQEDEDPLAPGTSWHNQLRDIRERAQRYKKRSEGVHIRHLLPLTRRDLKDHSDSSTPSLSDYTSSPTPSDSLSCVYSNCPHHEPSRPTTDPSTSLRGHKQSGSSNVHTQNVHPRPQAQDLAVRDIEEDFEEVQPTGCAPTVCKGIPVSSEPLTEEPGRVQTPTLQKSASDFRRHHFDLTTPMGGGLFISPKKQPEPKLPYPQVSPKFRRDMRSSAPISPAPKATSDEDVHDSHSEVSLDSGSPVDNLALSQPPSSSPSHTRYNPTRSTNLIPAQRSSSILKQKASSIPARRPSPIPVQGTSPIQARRPSPIPAQSSVRKLDFKPTLTTKSNASTSKMQPTSYSYRVKGLEKHSEDNCQVCGAHLKSAIDHSTLQTRPGSQARTSSLFNSGLSRANNPSIASTHQHTTNGRSEAGPSYMDRLPSQIESRPRDFDESSLASVSLSSCSVASDVLRKARGRRDNFWTQPKHVTAS